MKHLALDAHARTSELSVRDARGRLIDCRQVPTEAHALIESIGHVAGRKTLVVEESNLAGWLKRTLEPVTRFIVQSEAESVRKDEAKGFRPVGCQQTQSSKEVFSIIGSPKTKRSVATTRWMPTNSVISCMEQRGPPPRRATATL